MLLAELEHYGAADVICLQECDRLKDLLPALPRHSHVSAFGPGKLHGLVILYRSTRYRLRASKTVYLDDEELHVSQAGVHEDYARRRRRGGTRLTKNIGLFAALEEVGAEGRGIVIATTHLFWHPKFAYERIRQCLILLRSMQTFRFDHGCEDWPTVIAGDFNTLPSEATYQILSNPSFELPPQMVNELNASRVVHSSLDKVGLAAAAAIPATTSGTGASTPSEGDNEVEEEQPPEEHEPIIAGTRAVNDFDGVVTVEELSEITTDLITHGGLRSAYEHAWKLGGGESFGGRLGFERIFGSEPLPRGLSGHDEPAYTCYTPLFKLTLDYLMIYPSPSTEVTALLRPARTDELGDGLPRKGLSASDHLAVGCEVAW